MAKSKVEIRAVSGETKLKSYQFWVFFFDTKETSTGMQQDFSSFKNQVIRLEKIHPISDEVNQLFSGEVTCKM